MPSLVLEHPFVSGRPCVKLTVGGPFLAEPIELICAIDTGARYQLFVTHHTRTRLGLDPASIRPSRFKLMDDTTNFPTSPALMRAPVIVDWIGRQRSDLYAHFRTFGQAYPPTAIHGYVGASFFTDETVDIDYATANVRIYLP